MLTVISQSIYPIDMRDPAYWTRSMPAAFQMGSGQRSVDPRMFGKSGPQSGPGQQNCAKCGKFLPNGGVEDEEGIAGLGKGVLLCPIHANEYGIYHS